MPSVTLGKKRPSEAIVQSGVKPKKIKFGDDGEAKTVVPAPAISAPDEIDFPRGGGSSFTPLEQKAIRAEAIKEADEEIFKEQNRDVKRAKKRLRNGQVKESSKKTSKTSGESLPRIEHLNYKRIAVGMRILGQVIEIHPLHVIISLPNQMLGHIPLPQVTHQLTERIEKLPDEGDSEDEQDESEEESPEVAAKRIPELQDIFRVGQYVQTIVTTIHAAGATAPNTDLGKPRNETDRGSRRIVLSTVPKEVNKEISGKDLVAGYVIAGAVKSVEDHGYVLDLGTNNVSGFLSFKDAKKGPWGKKKLSVGSLVQTCVRSMSPNGKVCTVTIEGSTLPAAKMTQLTSVESVLPGLRVRALITGVQTGGLNVQVLGYFAGTIDLTHLGKVDTSSHRIGAKIDARILWDIPETNPRQIALSVLPHVLNLASSNVQDDQEKLEDTYPVGTILEGLKVVRVEVDRGVVVAIGDKPIGFIHISNVSDEHVPTLSPSSGPWKIGTAHRGRIIGHSPLDALLHLSFKQSVLNQKFFKVTDVQVGQMVKGTVHSLTDSALFVAIAGNMHAVVWPNHFADIRLKHPERKFKVGSLIKCRVLVVDPEKNRICLTAKKTLLESQLPIIASIVDATVGALAHAVVYKVSERFLSVEFFNNVKGIVPLREATDTNPRSLEGIFGIGQSVKLRILEVDKATSRIIGSIVQATKPSPAVEIAKLEVGHTVTGPITVTDVHQDNIILELQPKDSATKLKALISLANLANHRGTTVQQVRASLDIGQEIKEQLVLVSKNVEKALLIVAVKPQAKAKVPTSAGGGSLKIGDLKVGMTVPGLIIRHHPKGSTLRLSKHVFATLYPTDVCDNFETGNPFPTLDSVISVTVLEVSGSDQKVVVSARPSRVRPVQALPVVDREVSSLDDLSVGKEIRGFVKTVADHGVFVFIGRGIDARIQIRELCDEFVKDWKSRFQVQQVVKGRILNINHEKGQVEMTLRSGDLKTLTGMTTLSDFTLGQKVDGVVKKVEDYGVFVEIKGTKISGLCHKSELVDENGPSIAETLKLLKLGDSVRAVILKIDCEKRKISFGLKPSYFFSDDLVTSDENVDSDAESASEGEEEQEDEDMEKEAESSADEHAVIDLRMSGDDDRGESEEEDDSPDIKDHPIAPLSLKLSGGLRWTSTGVQDNAMDTQSESESESSDDDQPAKKKKKRHEIEHDLTADLHNRTPQSSADFERLLLGSPNSSFLWIQFMSFHLQLSEIEKARETGRRALQTINLREEQERLNVWIALLNLENSYGTEQTLDSVFKEAARANDSKTIHLRLASILEDTQKIEATEEHYRKTCKKFSKSSKVWSLFGEFCMKHRKIDEARQLLQRSLLSLEKRKHLKTISKFAQMEYKLGDAERGRTIFEGIVDTHRKRLDLWNIYIDMEASQLNIHAIRGIFERAISLKLSKKKAKFLFKKWLELEKRMGDEAGVENVKDKAIEWTRNAAKGGPEQEQD